MSRSGKQAKLAERRGYAGAKASAASPKKLWPLREVIALDAGIAELQADDAAYRGRCAHDM